MKKEETTDQLNTSGPAEWQDVKEAEIRLSREVIRCVENLNLNPKRLSDWRRLQSAMQDDEVARDICAIAANEVCSDDKYVFCKENGVYRIVFNFEELPRQRRSKGLDQIHYLIEHAYQTFRCSELSKLDILHSGEKEKEIDEDAEGSVRIRQEHKDNDRQTLVDKKTIKSIMETVNKLDEELAEANEMGDIEKCNILETKKDDLLQSLKNVSGFKGRLKEFSTSKSRARSAAWKSINDAIKKINPLSSSLASYLDTYIYTGWFICYRPPYPIRWITHQK